MSKYIVDEQLPEYSILNVSECGRFWIEGYERRQGYQASEAYDTWLEANKLIEDLKFLDRDPSYMVSILGYESYEEHYIKVVYKVRFVG